MGSKFEKRGVEVETGIPLRCPENGGIDIVCSVSTWGMVSCHDETLRNSTGTFVLWDQIFQKSTRIPLGLTWAQLRFSRSRE